MPLSDFSPYSTIAPFIDESLKPSFVADEEDKMRLASYSLYEQIWRNIPDTFELVQQGTDKNPIYIPSAKKCIEATNRYLGVGFDYRIEGGDQNSRKAIDIALKTLFKREKFRAKFGSLKRMSLVRGDALWHITADETRPAGRRISMHELNPSMYHPIYDPNDVDKLNGVHIVQPYIDPAEKNKPLVRRQTYLKVPQATGPDQISSSQQVFEADGWDDRQLLLNPDYKIKPWASPFTVSEFILPPEITSIPVYHVSNQFESGLPYGLSELSGFERVIAAINQGITDEELSLALDGLGVYFSTAPEPSGGWTLPPGTVITGDENQKFVRVNGVGSVRPSQDHLKYLGAEMQQAMGTPDIAVGNVDVRVAQSGIALALQMGPILTRNREKEDELLAVHDHMFFDLANGWFPAYEQLTVGAVSVNPFFGDPMPIDRDAIIKEITGLMATTPPLISAEYGRMMLAERLGMDFPSGMADNILAEIEANSKAQAFDPFAERVMEELAADQGAEGIPVTANGSTGA